MTARVQGLPAPGDIATLTHVRSEWGLRPGRSPSAGKGKMRSYDVRDFDVDNFFTTIPQAARAMGIAEAVLREAVKQGELRAYQMRKKWIRISVHDLREWIDSKRVVSGNGRP